MSDERETVTLLIPESFTFGNFEADDFERVLSFFVWSLKDKNVEIDLSFVEENLDDESLDSSEIGLLALYLFFLKESQCSCTFVYLNDPPEIWDGNIPPNDWTYLYDLINANSVSPPYNGASIIINNSEDREKALDYGEKYIEKFNLEYDKTLRYIINELLYNTLEHGKNGKSIPSIIQFFWNNESKELSFLVADIGVGIRKHLRQTYPNLVTDSEAILYSIKPQVSGTFGRQNAGYETKNNAGVGLFFSSNITQRLNADMFIVSGNGFVHISPTEIIRIESSMERDVCLCQNKTWTN